MSRRGFRDDAIYFARDPAIRAHTRTRPRPRPGHGSRRLTVRKPGIVPGWQADWVQATSGIEHERAVLAGELADLTGTEPAAAERAMVLVHERHPVGRRNLVSVLATVAQLNALLSAMPSAERRDYLTRTQGDGRTRLDRLLGGELDRVAGQICDEVAGPYDVPWDGNWPCSRPRPRGRIPAAARPGDVLAGGDGGGTRIKIRVVVVDDDVLTGEEVRDSWRDPPSQDVWLATYRRLERLYPGEIPPPPGTGNQ